MISQLPFVLQGLLQRDWCKKKSSKRKQLDLEILFTLEVSSLLSGFYYSIVAFKVFRDLDIFKLLGGLGLRV